MGGVRVESIYNYVSHHKIRARRCPILEANPNPQASYDLVIAALTRLNRWYSPIGAVSVWWNSFWGFSKLDFAMTESRTHICSNLYTDSYLRATNRLLEYGAFPTPAALSATTALRDVVSGWKRLAS